ncbi:hypothetical protein I546_6437 [Mycobacterium kansasii 732]|nr:hypothetical protein I546_6437 [Mycobacterium kansasii 732]
MANLAMRKTLYELPKPQAVGHRFPVGFTGRSYRCHACSP